MVASVPVVRRATSPQQARVLPSGDTLALFAGVAGAAPLNLPPGVAPTAPVNGDVWATAAGLFVRVAGVTVGPLGAAGGGGSSAAFVAFTFATGWAHFGAGYHQGGYFKLGNVVFLIGTVVGDGSGTSTIATLPVGFRPPAASIVRSFGSGGGQIDIDPAGVVSFTGGATVAALSLAGVSFVAA